MITIKRQLCCLAVGLGVVLGMIAPVGAQVDGMVIRVMDRLLFIDAGQHQGVQEGEFFNILSTNIVSHPITGDTLAIAPKNIGAIRVIQVYEKMALGEVIQLQEDTDPMLMQISRVKDTMRRQELEAHLQWHVKTAKRSGLSPLLGFVPGVYQIRSGSPVKGWIIAGVQGIALGSGIVYRLQSNDWLDQYNALPETSKQFDFYFEGASDRRRMSNRLFLLAGAVYTYNLIDAMWMSGRSNGMGVGQAQRRWEIGMGLAREGHAQLQLTRRF